MNRWKRPSPTNWKKPLIISFASLFTIILIVPTLIVVPFIQPGGVEKGSVNTEASTDPPVAIQASDSPFSVKVYRSQLSEAETVPLEEYVSRVVASEMPADFELEALKAQALAARTYIVNYLMYNNNGKGIPDNVDADVTDTVQHQVYKSDEELLAQWGPDYDWKMEKINRAVAETMGEIITYEDQPITPAFFSTSNGYTENSEDYWQNELPYLRSVASPWDQQESPKFSDQKVLTVAEVEERLGIQLDQLTESSFQITRTDSNRVEEVILGGKTFTGRDIRKKLDLRSSDFEIEQKNDHLIFTTKGYGHGIGMSQYGANGMAKEGKNYKEIVTYYYKGANINEVVSTAPKLAARSE